MWIKREIEGIWPQLRGEVPVMVVTGPRQTGKTSLLQRLEPDARLVSLDLPRLAEEADESGELFLKRHGEPLIIDEVQYAPKVFRYLKAFVDQERSQKARYFLSGSQRFSLMKNVSESLAGRATIIELMTLSIAELERAFELPADKGQLVEWIWRGGFPELHDSARDPERFFSSYVATYIERDIRQMIDVRSERDFDRFLRLCALRSGQLLVLNSFATDLGISPTTARSWLDALVASGLAYLLEPWHSNLSKRLIKTPKLYLTDTGLLCYLAGLRSPSELLASPLLGPIFETHTCGQIIRSFSNRALKPRLYFFRDHYGHEVDFVVPAGNQIHLLECKWSEAPAANRAPFQKAIDILPLGQKVRCHIVSSARDERGADADMCVRGSVDWSFLHGHG